MQSFSATPQPTTLSILYHKTILSQVVTMQVRSFCFELSTAWVHVASQAIYRFEPPELSGLNLAGLCTNAVDKEQACEKYLTNTLVIPMLWSISSNGSLQALPIPAASPYTAHTVSLVPNLANQRAPAPLSQRVLPQSTAMSTRSHIQSGGSEKNFLPWSGSCL